VPWRPAPSLPRTPPPLPVTPGESPSSTSQLAELSHPPPQLPLPQLPPLPPQSSLPVLLQVLELEPELDLDLPQVLEPQVLLAVLT